MVKEINKEKCIWILIFFLTAFILSWPKHLQAISIEDIKVLKISPQDQKAIIKISSGDMVIIKAGDDIAGNIKVIDISEGRIVVEEMTERGAEKVIIKINDGEQKIMRIRKFEDKKPFLYVPQQSSESKAPPSASKK